MSSEKPLKVLFTIDSLQQGGAEQSIVQIISHFSKNTEVSVLYFYPKADLLKEYREAGCNIIAMNLQGKYEWLKAISGMMKVLKENKPDVVVSSLYRSNIISRIACRLTNTKLVGTFVDDSYSIERKRTFRGIGRIKYSLTWLLDRLTAFIPQKWLSNSIYIKNNNAAKLGISPKKIEVVYRGRDVSNIREWQNPKSDFFDFVTIGRLYEKKGFLELIEAFAELYNNHKNIRLIIFGEGKLRGEMEKMIANYGLADNVKLMGNVPNAGSRLFEYNCFVFPSRFEGFSGALVEAMMTGIPIIASDIPMNLEAVENNNTAIVHEVRNKKDLFEKMDLLIRNYPDMIEMGQRARKTAMERFDIKTISKQYENVLKKVVAN